MSTNITWHKPKITRTNRETLNGNKTIIIWFTGLPSSGKSTIANALESELYDLGVRSYVLDGDNVRQGLNKDLGFSPGDRTENIRRFGEVAKLMKDAGNIPITAVISPYASDRQSARDIVKEGDFIEIYVKCPVAVCEERDPKGLYKKARNGEIKDFTGVDAPYEEPRNPELVLETDKLSLEECVNTILDYLANKDIIRIKKVA